jgi:hypothetical protein
MRSRRRGRKLTIRASDLAKMAVCEQRLVFEQRYGERLTRAQEERIRDGDRGHARFLRQAFAVNPGVRSSQSKRGCFIATEAQRRSPRYSAHQALLRRALTA